MRTMDLRLGRLRASATVTSTAGTLAVAPVLTQIVLRLQIPDCRVLMTPAVGPVSPGRGWPWRCLCRYLSRPCRPLVWHRILPSCRLTSLLLSIIHLCLGPARRPPPTGYSRLTRILPCLRGWVLRCPRLGRQSWPGLSRSFFRSRRSRDCRRSSSRRIVFARISMWIWRTFAPCLTHYRCQMVIYLWSRRPQLRNRSRLTRRVKPSLFIAPVSVRRRRCPSLTALRSCSSCHRRRLLFRRRSRSKPIPPCCFISPRRITSGFLSLRRILCSSPSLFRKGPFDATTCPAATTEQPLILRVIRASTHLATLGLWRPPNVHDFIALGG